MAALVRVAGTALLVLLAVCALAIGAMAVAPRFVPVQTLVVMSGSMEPALPTGSVIVLEPASASDLRVGDVITFARPDRTDELITHRIVAEDTSGRVRGLITKGDASGVADPWIVPAVGTGWRVSADIPLAGYALVWMSSPMGRVALVVVPVLVFTASMLAGIWRRP